MQVQILSLYDIVLKSILLFKILFSIFNVNVNLNRKTYGLCQFFIVIEDLKSTLKK